VELLVVISIIALLVAILMPALGRIHDLALRLSCSTRQREIARACATFAMDKRMHRTGARDALPITDTPPGPGNWGDLQNGNPACLWLLIEHKFAPRKVFLCPAAARRRNFKAPASDEKYFTEKTYSYSYLSQVEFTDNETNKTYAATSSHEVSSQLIIVADQNPRCVPGITNIDADENKNSENHGGEGQNVTTLGGSTKWIESPDDTSGGDDIYAAENGDEASGQRGNFNDSFLIP